MLWVVKCYRIFKFIEIKYRLHIGGKGVDVNFKFPNFGQKRILVPHTCQSTKIWVSLIINFMDIITIQLMTFSLWFQ